MNAGYGRSAGPGGLSTRRNAGCSRRGAGPRTSAAPVPRATEKPRESPCAWGLPRSVAVGKRGPYTLPLWLGVFTI